MATASTLRYTKIDIVAQYQETLNANNATFNVTDVAGAPVDLTIFSGASFIIKKVLEPVEVLVYSTADNSLVLASGSFVINDESLDLSAGVYAYVFTCNNEDETVVVAKGQLIIRK